jgi:hypothetical protein
VSVRLPTHRKKIAAKIRVLFAGAQKPIAGERSITPVHDIKRIQAVGWFSLWCLMRANPTQSNKTTESKSWPKLIW